MKHFSIGFLAAFISSSAFADAGLEQLSAVTFTCTQAALNAAAKSVAAVEANGTYHFTYFKELNGGADYSAIVKFQSNTEGEAQLEYTVTLYCQQGWDPNSTVTVIRK